jgi:hypothetical protein
MKKILVYLKMAYEFVRKNFVMVLLGLVVLFFVMWRIESNISTKNKDKYETEVKIRQALLDDLHQYENKNKELVNEKLALQASVEYLTKNNGDLNKAQQELLARVKEVQKTNSIIVAALIETNVKIDSLRKGKVVVNEKDSTIIFSDSTKNLKYNIEIGHVKPVSPIILPTLKFNDFQLPNKQFVEFHWKNDKKLGYPIAFSVSNSNDYFKTTNINSYAIPKLNKVDVDPNFWNKSGAWFKKNSQKVTYIGIGVATAVIVLKFL